LAQASPAQGAGPGPRTVRQAWREPPPAAAVFEGLRDFKSLTRERALASLQQGLKLGRFPKEEVENLVFAALSSEAWEAKQGGLQAAAAAVSTWDAPEFRKALLAEVPRLLVDAEYRVRKAVAAVLLECCQRDGLAVYDDLSETVLGDIRENFRRSPTPEEEVAEIASRPPTGTLLPPTFLPDTEGWRSLETSMGALEAMMQGCGAAFTPRITLAMLELLADCSRHTNRFVREYAYFAMVRVFEVCEVAAFLENIGPKTVGLVAAGIRDNWSQVRYAASVAARAFCHKAGEQCDRFYPKLLGLMCLNRHYVAEGVRLYSQDTWKFICGPQGGARLLVAHFDNVIDAFVDAAEAPNHAVREAACHCISELVRRVAGTPAEPTPYRHHFTHDRVRRLTETLLSAFQDESWPVRDVASTAVGHFVLSFPLDCEGYRDQLLGLWFEQMADNIPSLRKNGAAALALAVRVWTKELWDDVAQRLEATLPEVLQQEENSEVFADYTPSGPFSVPRAKPQSLEAEPSPMFTDQTMMSCGSMAPKTFKRDRRAKASERLKDAGGCMNCSVTQPHQLWEASEGMVHLLTDLAELVAAQQEVTGRKERADALAALLPSLAKAFGCSQFRHHHLLKQRVCERLPALTKALGPERLLPHLPELLRLTAECAAQDSHRALRECAYETLDVWKRCLEKVDLDRVSCEAGVDLSQLAGA